MSERKDNDVPEAVEEPLTYPDAPGNATPPPQTIDAEPAQERR